MNYLVPVLGYYIIIKLRDVKLESYPILLHFADKSVILWDLRRDEACYGIPKKRLQGHGHFVSDVVISSDGQFALSGSWDHTLRLWDLTT